MAEEKVPYRFSVYGVEFDVTFSHTKVPLDYKDPILYSDIELAFARQVGTVKTLGAKSVRNPHDYNNEIIGQRVAFKRLMEVVYGYWFDGNQIIVSEKDFVNRARSVAYLAGMWNTDEE